MDFTLDSKELTLQSLEKRFKKEFIATPIILSDLKTIHTITEDKNTFYFGVLTYGDNDTPCSISFLNKSIIKIESNSQIVEVFNSIAAHAKLPIDDIKGHFRGFIIQPK